LGVVDRGASPSQTAGSFSDVADVKTCVIRASLSGYRPQTIALESFVKAQKANLGEIVLQPASKQGSVLTSVTDADVPQKVRKDYDAGLDDAAKSKWPEAIAAMEKATGAHGKFATAWLSLGMLQASRGNSTAALRSYAQAIAADDKFAPVYVELAAALTVGNEWDKAIEAAGKATALDAEAFPRAYYIAAVSSVRLTQADAAEKFAEQGIRVDADHEFPDLEYIEGILLFAKADVPGGRKHLESYLSYAPNGVNAANARQQLAETAASK
jgi:tetratricopeptide (TPR) repeat protein